MADPVVAPPVDPNSAAPPSPGAPSPGAGSPLVRPEWLPETAWDTTANSVKLDALQPILTAHQAAEARRATLPAKPEDYKVELPADFKLPDKSPVKLADIKINENDPRIPLVRQFAHEFGLPQEAVGKLVALDAQMQINDRVAYEAAETARLTEENKKLGANAETRVTAVASWGKGLMERGEINKTELDTIHRIAVDAAGVTLLEKLIAKANGTVMPPRIPANEPVNQPTEKIPGYDTMTFEQRRAAQWNKQGTAA